MWIRAYRLTKKALIPIIGVDRFARCTLLTMMAAKAGQEYLEKDLVQNEDQDS